MFNFKLLSFYIFIFFFVNSNKQCLSLKSRNLDTLKSPLNKTVNELTFKLFHQLIEKEPNQCNIFFSPFSILLMFSMLLHGTKGASQKEILETFNFNKDNNFENINVIHQSFQDLLYEISKKQRNYTMNIGSIGLFKNNLNPNRHFRTKLFEYYNAVLTNINFTNIKQTNEVLNNWIKTITYNKLNSFSEKTFDPRSNFVFLNTIFFQGKWKYPFALLKKQYTFYNQINIDKINKTQHDQNNNEGILKINKPEENKDDKKNPFNQDLVYKPTKVSMMAQLKTFKYKKNDDFELIELPYEEDLSMFIILPNHEYKMQHVLLNLNSSFLNHLIDDMETEKLKIMMPKFKIEQNLDLKFYLKNLGLKKIFEEDVDFSPMFNEEIKKIYLNQAIHKAVIDIDEKGTTAFSSTVLKSLVVSGSKEILVQINRPFIFIIKDTVTNIIYFAGTLCNFT